MNCIYLWTVQIERNAGTWTDGRKEGRVGLWQFPPNEYLFAPRKRTRIASFLPLKSQVLQVGRDSQSFSAVKNVQIRPTSKCRQGSGKVPEEPKCLFVCPPSRKEASRRNWPAEKERSTNKRILFSLCPRRDAFLFSCVCCFYFTGIIVICT